MDKNNFQPRTPMNNFNFNTSDASPESLPYLSRQPDYQSHQQDVNPKEHINNMLGARETLNMEMNKTYYKERNDFMEPTMSARHNKINNQIFDRHFELSRNNNIVGDRILPAINTLPEETHINEAMINREKVPNTTQNITSIQNPPNFEENSYMNQRIWGNYKN